MALIYKPYFSIELTHGYFADGRCRGVRVVPDKLTQELLSKHKILFRQVENRLFFLIYSDAVGGSVTDYTPFLPLSDDAILRFVFIVDDYQFYNYTNVISNTKSHKYIFTNKVDNTLSGSNYLSSSISPFQVGKYETGELCVSDLGGLKVYEATQLIVPVYAQAPDNDNSYEFIPSVVQATSLFPSVSKDISDYLWFLRGDANSYAAVSGSDRLQFISNSYIARFSSPVDEIGYSIQAYNPITNQYDLTVLTEQHIFMPEPVTEFKIPVGGYKPGRYRIIVNGQNSDVVVSNDPAYNAALGVVEICVNSTDEYRLHDDDGVILNPHYKIHFSNRLVFWKYKSARSIDATAGVGAIKFCNIGFNALWQQPSDTVSNNFLGTSLLPIPLFDKVIDNSQLVYPQANAPPLIYTNDPTEGILPLQDIKLPIPQANNLNGIQVDTIDEKFLASVNSLSF